MDTALSPVGLLLGGRYHVGSRIARGGMATVYLGTDTRLDRVVALKIAHPELSDDAEFVRRFIGEARSAARLSSPNVVGIYDQGSDKRLHYIAMEYVAGRTLRELLNERGRLSPREALDIMTGILAGLDAAHEAGFAHRDVKPENVLITGSGTVKVADFGLARAVAGAVQTKGGMIIGTAAYLAPEQISGGTSDARTDVYAAGIVLFELLTGKQPHTADSPLAVAYKHVNEVVPAPSSVVPGLSPALDAMVAMATSRDPDLRPASAGQFLQAIQEIRDGQTGPGTAAYPSPQHGMDQHGAGLPGAGLPGAAVPAAARYADSAPYPAPDYQGPVNYSGPLNYSEPVGYPGAADYAAPPDYPAPPNYPGEADYSAPPGYPGLADYYGADYPGPHGNSGPGNHYGPGDYSGPPGTSGPGEYSGPVGHSQGGSYPYQQGGAIGASALPSLSPQSAGGPAFPGPHDEPAANHTLVVSDAALFDDYGQGGYGQGGGYNGGSTGRSLEPYRRGRLPARRSRQQRSEPWLQRSLFSHRFFYVLGALAVVVVIALLGWWLTTGRYETIPMLKGDANSVAQQDLRNLGLTVTYARPIHSPLPKGEVVKAVPAHGSRVARGSTVTLTLSLGPVLIEVPNVSGQPLAQAESGLRTVHLRPGTITHAVSSSVPVGDVISTTPRAYSKCPESRRVGLTVSAGPGLPNFVGQQVSAAQTAAQAGGYTINQVTDAKGSDPANTIVRQSPLPNTPITQGEVVTVYVSPGPPGVPVPNVDGMQLPQAIQELERAGFSVSVSRQGPGNTVGNYSPQGTQPKGSTITLDVGFLSGL
jgi:serine/threonine protein kinase/beta-lactam-binding protein with PASTA domain